MGKEVVEAVFEDWRTAPVEEPLRAALGFVEALTLRPAEVGPETMEPLREAGLSDRDIEDVAAVCALFNVIVRVADTLGFDVPPDEFFDKMAGVMLKRGY